MAIDIKNLVAAINPDVYCDNEPDLAGRRIVDDVKALVKEKGYLAAAAKAKLKAPQYIDVLHVAATKSPFKLEGLKKGPIEQHVLSYDAFSQSLEPVYFWILDYVNGAYGKADKLIDNFVSSAGSGHFAEMSGRASRMHDEASKMMQSIGVVTRSVIQLIYDLKEFRIRLAQYEDFHSKDPRVKNAALLSLKQIWMDNVDIKRGNGSINGLAQQLDFVTVRDAFMAARSLKDLDSLDLNDRVKRILQQRISEFERWVVESERELTKRYEIERTYLRSQYNSLKLYSRWAKPYFKASRQLEQTMSEDANIVNAFNTTLFELVLLAQGKYDPAKDVASGELPKSYLYMTLRKYIPMTLIEFKFRTIPERTNQAGGSYTYRGKVDVTFTSFALNEDELQVLKQQVDDDNFGDVFKVIEGATDETIGHLKEDLDKFLDGEKIEAKGFKDAKETPNTDVNPFTSLFAFDLKKEEKKDLTKGIPKDNDFEKVLRNQAVLSARMDCRKLYDTYKKAHGMPAFPPTINF